VTVDKPTPTKWDITKHPGRPIGPNPYPYRVEPPPRRWWFQFWRKPAK
jgi:hypothetical protein